MTNSTPVDGAGLVERFGIDAVDLDMIRRGDMLGTALGAKVYEALTKCAEMEEALRPSADTKAAYIGEFQFSYTVWDPHGEFEITHRPVVPWTTIKEIMAAIKARALNGASHDE